MKRFISMEMCDYPDGFGKIMAPEESAVFRTIQEILGDYRVQRDTLLMHGVVAHERSSDVQIPDLCDELRWVNEEPRGGMLHDGEFGHDPVKGVSFVALNVSEISTVCANVRDIANATLTVLQLPENKRLFTQGEVVFRRQMTKIPQVIEDICRTLSSEDLQKNKIALQEIRCVVRDLTKPSMPHVSRDQLLQLAEDIQHEATDSLVPINWQQYWLAHMDDSVVHGRDMRQRRYRDHQYTFGYCAQKDY